MSDKGTRQKTGGRKKGTPNKLTADVKAMILTALDRAGGVDYLLTQSADNPVAFLSLVGKVLPMTVAGDPANPLVHTIERRIVRPVDRNG
jgi:hypothetical protein